MGHSSDSVINILQDPMITYEKKMEITDEIYRLPLESQLVIYPLLIKESEKRDDKKNIAKLYSFMSHAYLYQGSLDSCKYYLDLASLYIDETYNAEVLGIYNHVYGDYYNMQHDYKSSHKYYYKAIDCFQKSKKKQYRRRPITIFHSIAFPYIQEKDISSFKIILDRMYREVQEINDDKSESIYYGLLSYYYGCKYEEQKEVLFLDSAIICDERVVRIYETELGQKDLYPEEMAYRYINLSNNKLRRENPDYAEINSLAKKARDLSNPVDTAMLSNCLWVEGLSLYEMNDKKMAEGKLLDLVRIMDNWGVSNNLEMYSNLCQLLSRIYISYGDYEKALMYERKKNECELNIYSAEKFKVIKELQTRYETEKKEQEIRMQKRINIFIAFIAVLSVVAAFFIIRWQRANRRLLSKQLEIIKQEKSNIENTIEEQEKRLREAKIKEQEIAREIEEKEQLVKDVKLEGLSALIEAKQEIQLLKRQEIQLLKNQKEELENTISSAETDIIARVQERDEIFTHLHELIDRKIVGSQKNNILNAIAKIDDSSILLLRNRGLKPLDIEYSILIAAGLSIEELTFVYSVANQTVRSHRSKIREAFNLEASINLDTFLLRLLIPH